jgi:hypothetical protein
MIILYIFEIEQSLNENYHLISCIALQISSIFTLNEKNVAGAELYLNSSTRKKTLLGRVKWSRVGNIFHLAQAWWPGAFILKLIMVTINSVA